MHAYQSEGRTPQDRGALVLKLEPLYAAEAKRKQIRKPESVRQKSDEQTPIRTDEQLAKGNRPNLTEA